MILGVAARDDAEAARITEFVCGARDRQVSVHGGVALVACSGGSPAAVYAGDHAYVGALAGGAPSTADPLIGDFACVARAGRSLRLSCGRFVGRPLFWVTWNGATVACSRLAPLARLLGGGARLNVDHVLAMFDMSLWLTRPLPFEQLRRVAANTIVDLDAAGTVRTTHGVLELEPEIGGSPHQVSRRLREEFEAGVSRLCTGFGKVGVFAAGGVDSSNLLAMAVRNSRLGPSKPDVLPLTVEYGGIGDDRPYMAALTRSLEVQPLRVHPAEGAPFHGQDHVIDGTAHATAPGGAMIAALHRARALGVEVALTGEGAELLFDADGAVFADFMVRSPLRALRSACRFRDLGDDRARSLRRLVVSPFARHLAPGWMRRRARKGRIAPSWAGSRLVAHFERYLAPPLGPPVRSQRDRVAALASSDVLSANREYMSRWEVAGGTTIRFGYFDDAFVRFVARIPSAMIFSGDRERGLLRESMEGIVPDTIRYRMDKAAPHLAFVELFQAMGGLDAVGDLATVRELARLDVVREQPFRTELERFARHPLADTRGWFKFWRTLSAEAFLRWSSSLSTGSA